MWHQLDKYSVTPHETWAAKCGNVGCLVMVKSPDDPATTVALTFVPGMTVAVKDGDNCLVQLEGFGQAEPPEPIPDADEE